jgi:hypothetical protein
MKLLETPSDSLQTTTFTIKEYYEQKNNDARDLLKILNTDLRKRHLMSAAEQYEPGSKLLVTYGPSQRPPTGSDGRFIAHMAGHFGEITMNLSHTPHDSDPVAYGIVPVEDFSPNSIEAAKDQVTEATSGIKGGRGSAESRVGTVEFAKDGSPIIGSINVDQKTHTRVRIPKD